MSARKKPTKEMRNLCFGHAMAKIFTYPSMASGLRAMQIRIIVEGYKLVEMLYEDKKDRVSNECEWT